MSEEVYVAWVDCQSGCGRVGLTEDQYQYQAARHEEHGWFCPCCCGSAQFSADPILETL